jgi:hypothetical protein
MNPAERGWIITAMRWIRCADLLISRVSGCKGAALNSNTSILNVESQGEVDASRLKNPIFL